MTVGVQVNVSTLPGPGTVESANGSTYFAMYQTMRGNPITPTPIASPGQYASTFGPFVPYGFGTNDMAMFFGEGGTDAVIARVVGPAATAGDAVLEDATSTPTLTVTAGCPSINPVTGASIGNVADPGAWSSSVSVQPIASTLTGNFELLVFYQGVEEEHWGPFATVAAAVTAINASSSYLLATNMFDSASGTAAFPAPLTNPVALSAGSDDRTHITVTQYTAALAQFPEALGAGYVAIPGQDASIVGASLLAYGTPNDRLVHLSPVQGLTFEEAQAAAASFRGNTGSQNAGYFWPWVMIPGGQVVPPDGFVAGRYSATSAKIGPWQAPAGPFGQAKFVIGLDPSAGVITDAIGNQLDTARVNVIRPKNGVSLYGWRSLTTDLVNWDFLTQAGSIDLIATNLDTQEAQYDFALVDSLGQLFSKMTATAIDVLQPFITAGALYPGPLNAAGQPADPGYVIDTSSDVNTPVTLAANQAIIDVYVRPGPTAALISVGLVKVAVGSNF
jgi:hypothetical protein